MTIEQKEKLSLFMDGEIDNIAAVAVNEEIEQDWHRYHIIRSVLKKELHPIALNLDISRAVSKAIEDENSSLIPQPTVEELKKEQPIQLMWAKTKDAFTKFTQVGLAACVTLAIITGVQHYQNGNEADKYPVLNTMPVGVSISPVGGVKVEAHDNLNKMDENQYNKIRLLIQDYELQKRLNAH